MYNTNYLEFLADRFNLNLEFLQLFISSCWLEIGMYVGRNKLTFEEAKL